MNLTKFLWYIPSFQVNRGLTSAYTIEEEPALSHQPQDPALWNILFSDAPWIYLSHYCQGDVSEAAPGPSGLMPALVLCCCHLERR